MTEEALFESAVKLPVAERGAFLERECAGRPEMRARLEALLAADDRTGGWHDPQAPSFTGTVFAGRYKVRERLGEGGMGVVYVADQTEPVQRRVALKIIRANLPSEKLLARFEQERQALALMDHPNIAKVYDAGIAERSPYFVMELIKGLPITKYCDEFKLTPQERLELFLPVCQAVQHAHQKGIIHRDLKPSNIIVGLYDGRAVPKVIDFGVAKMSGPKLTEHSVYTEAGTIIGTLEYMSPEQAELNNLDIDTRTDIYALGVILYELLTGTVPFSRKELQSAGFAEMLRAIREREPAKPSTKLSASGNLPAVAACRHTEPAKLTKLMRGDLDWIVMKALEKDRGRRYETANGLAMDIQRHLVGEAVLAAPPSTVYRMRKFVRRNRPQVIAASLVLLALLAGMAGTTWGLLEARKQAEIARAEAKAKEDALQAEAEERRKAQTSEAEANAVIQFFEDHVFAAARPKGQAGGLGAGVTLRDAIAASEPVLGKGFANQPLVEARLRRTLGVTFRYLGDAERAAEQDEQARALFTRHRGPDHPDTLVSMHNLAASYMDLNRPTEALKMNEEVLAIRKRVLPKDHPHTLMSMHNLAVGYARLNRPTEALKMNDEILAIRKRVLPPDHPDTLESMHNLAASYMDLNRPTEALKMNEEVVAIRKRVLPKDHPDTLKSMINLAHSYQTLNRPIKALKLLEEVVAIQKQVLPKDHPDTLKSMINLAAFYHILNRPTEAVKLNEEVLAIRKRVLPPDHPDTLKNMINLALSYQILNRHDDALPLVNEVLAKANRPGIDPRLAPLAIRLRLQLCLKANDPAGCRTSAEMWEKLNRPDAESLYSAACYRAVTAAVQAKTPGADTARLTREDADKAMAWLQQAVAAGYKDAAHMKKDTDLDPLRDREDFKKLMAELESKTKKK